MSDGTLSYAIVSRSAAAVARNIYLEFEVAFPIGGKREVAWAVAERFPALRDELDRFIARVKRDGTLARLTERYVPNDTVIPPHRRWRAAATACHRCCRDYARSSTTRR